MKRVWRHSFRRHQRTALVTVEWRGDDSYVKRAVEEWCDQLMQGLIDNSAASDLSINLEFDA